MKPTFDITADLDTPVSAYLKLRPFRPRFLLESVEGGERLARYSFIGFGDALELRLDAAGLLDESDGAKVVWVPGFTNREGDPLPLIVQARTGGFNYATSDITCVLDRVERLHATLLVYCIGTPQSQHLQMVWKATEMLGVLVPPARAVHVNNGNVLGEDRKILKSRSGEPAMLLDLVDAAIEHINDTAIEHCDEPLLEGDDPITVNEYARQELFQ